MSTNKMTPSNGQVSKVEFSKMKLETKREKLVEKLSDLLEDIGSVELDLKSEAHPYMVLKKVFNSDVQLRFSISSRGLCGSNNALVIRMRNIGDRRNSYWVDLEKLLSGDDKTVKKLREIVETVIEHRQFIRKKNDEQKASKA